jgi:hypothetical protein
MDRYEIQNRVNVIKAMDYILAQDEEIYMAWLNFYPDGVTDEELREWCADPNDEFYNECCQRFVKYVPEVFIPREEWYY